MADLPRAQRARTVPGQPIARTTGRGVARSPDVWEPKYPDAAVGMDDLRLSQSMTAEQAIESQGDDPWTLSPASSHTEMFRLIDAGSVRETWVYGPDGSAHKSIAGTRLAVVNARSGVGSTIWVRFKPTRTRPAYMYVFFFGQDHATARSVFEEMRASNSPWTVGHQRLEKAGVPYRRVSGSAYG